MIGIRGQIILAIIPTFVTQLIAFYRIRKFTNGIVIEVILFLLNILIQMIVQWPFGLIVALPITIGIPVYFVRKWTLEYNEPPRGLFS